ncbi:lipopolysaccharide biosynthesis protein [Pedobacter suwonensis]|uniref:lipopolysaccharide biosynthesis protein n=1 Tax=Pedobacter suwonensis TaxID=332999 RepID=UPI003694C204
MTTESQKMQTANSKVSLRELIIIMRDWKTYLLSKWITFLIFCLLGVTLGLAYAIYKKPTYTAITTFVLEDGEKTGGLANLGNLASMAGIDIGGGGGVFQGDNIIELYKSRLMIQKALLTPVRISGKPILLIDRFIAIYGLKSKWKRTAWSKVNFSAINQHSVLKDSILREVVKNINENYLSVGKPDKKLSKIKVEVKSQDELFAKTFSEQLVAAVNDFYVKTKTKRSASSVAVLQHKADSVRAVMNGAIYAAVEVTDATPNLNPTRQVQRVAPAQKAQFSAETNKAILSEMVKNLEITKMALLKETPLIQLIDTPILPLEVEKTSKVKYAVIGGMLFGFLAFMILVIRKIYLDAVA